MRSPFYFPVTGRFVRYRKKWWRNWRYCPGIFLTVGDEVKVGRRWHRIERMKFKPGHEYVVTVEGIDQPLYYDIHSDYKIRVP